jgi:hypothetical protein
VKAGFASPAAALVAAAGVATTVFNSLGAVLIVDLPRTDAAPAEVAAYLAGSRGTVLVACYAWGLGTSAMLVFAAGLHAMCRERGNDLYGTPALVAATILSGFMFLGFGLLAALAFRQPADADTVRFLNSTVFVLLGYAGFPAAAWCALVTVSMSKLGIGRQWVGWLGSVSAILHLVAAGALAGSGLLSPSGPVAYISPAAISAWIAALTLVAWADGRNGRVAGLFWRPWG